MAVRGDGVHPCNLHFALNAQVFNYLFYQVSSPILSSDVRL